MRRVKIWSSIVFLFAPPALGCIAFSYLERDEFVPFSDMQVRGSALTLTSEEDLQKLHELTDALFKFQKEQPESRGTFANFERILDSIKASSTPSDLQNFQSEISRKFTEHLGVFANLPYYRACLTNRNVIEILGEIAQPLGPEGALAINQDQNGYDFYAVPGNSDCKDVNISKFKASTSSTEVGYIYVTLISPQEEQSMRDGKPFTVHIATTSTITSHSKVTVRLTWWVIAIAYLLLLFAWSFIFFQCVKVLEFFSSLNKRDTAG